MAVEEEMEMEARERERYIINVELYCNHPAMSHETNVIFKVIFLGASHLGTKRFGTFFNVQSNR